MSAGRICSREAVARVRIGVKLGLSEQTAAPPPRCIMHLDRSDKDLLAFEHELVAMRRASDFDHTRFVFPPSSVCKPAVIGGVAYFDHATFLDQPDFSAWHFTSSVSFDNARFPRGATFVACHFDADVSFVSVSFGSRRVDELVEVNLTAIADFTGASFGAPEKVIFRRVNYDTAQGLRLRAIGCNLERVNFDDINWHREWRRLVLQDELDLYVWSRVSLYGDLNTYIRNLNLKAKYVSPDPRPADIHELVAVTYARLVTTFDGRHNYDDAEDAFCGMMEMKRLDPAALPLNWLLEGAYKRFAVLRTAARATTVLSWYRLVSNYGSNYRRAFVVLLILLAIFSLVFAVASELSISPALSLSATATSDRFIAGCLASLEVATFQRDPLVLIGGSIGKSLRIVESIVVPSQVAIFLLALRRRFKR